MSEISGRLPPDHHNHTSLCKHATGRAVDYARAAVARGVTEMACTEHAPAPEPFDPEHRMALEDFSIYRDWVEEARQVDGVEVLFGIEADFYEGCEAFLGDWLAAQDFDLVLGSVHYMRYDRARGHALTGVLDGGDVAGSWQRYFARIGEMADSGLYDVASHLDLPKRFAPPPEEAVVEAAVKPALDRIAAAGMGIEINTSGWGHRPAEAYPGLSILGWAQERGIPLSFGSDAHEPQRMGAHFEEAVALARQAGYRERAEYRKRQRTLVPL
jgi:histidinol-phosphatase (PHP family)